MLALFASVRVRPDTRAAFLAALDDHVAESRRDRGRETEHFARWAAARDACATDVERTLARPVQP